MKIIDILNKIANGEEPPKKIKFGIDIYNYVEEEQDYKHEKLNDWLFCDYTISHILNDEVEILETTITYKPDKIEKFSEEEMNIYHDMPAPIDDIAHKINEIIDKVNEL